MTLSYKPIKVKDSLYLLIPKAIAQLLDIDEETPFYLSVEKDGDDMLLVIRTQRSDHVEILG